MPPMTNNKPQKPIAAGQPDTDEKSWERLFDDIRVLALRRAAGLLTEQNDADAFDRGARSLRTLMSSAEAARRMVRDEAKESDDQQSQEPAISDEQIADVYREIESRVADVAAELGGDAAGKVDREADRRGDHAAGVSGAGGEAVGDERP